MKAVIQRVTQSAVTVEGRTVGAIGPGLMVLLGVGHGDTSRDCRYLAEKIVNLRIFEDDQGKMNRSLLDVNGTMLVVSQFTLMGDCRKGRRPSFASAAPPEEAEARYLEFCECVHEKGIDVSTGRFGAMMQVSLINDGPVTLIVESKSA